uniref:RNA helicase n=2 Tax=Dendroctonus ponderosae TaxID=77166 RepID=A0AAR5PEV3_DENPD
MFTIKLAQNRLVFMGRMNFLQVYQPYTGKGTPIRQREMYKHKGRFSAKRTMNFQNSAARKSVNIRLYAIRASVKTDDAPDVLNRLSTEIQGSCKADAIIRLSSRFHTGPKAKTATETLSRLPTRIQANLSSAITFQSFLRPSGFVNQARLLVTKSDSHPDTGDPNGTDQIEHASKPSNGKVNIIEVANSTQIEKVAQKLPNPKNVVHNFFSVLADEMNDPAMKMSPTYKAMAGKAGNVSWACCYHMKWPENIKVVARETSKHKASALAARKVIDLLMTMGRLSADGTPIFYNKEDVKEIRKQKQTAINLDKSSIIHMQNIINIFNSDMKQMVETAEVQPADESSGFLAEDKQSAKLFMAREPHFLSAGQYFAKEKVSLPVTKLKEEFIDLIQQNNCIIVQGEPGCGKSSRIPQYVLEAWIKEETTSESFCRIAVTQPRRIAAISLSDRVASERDEELGHIVGYQVRLKSRFEPRTGRILYCTTGILLRHLQNDQNLSRFSHIILDEAHERDINTDLLMSLLRTALHENPRLKLVVMSATIDAKAFSEYFDGAPVFSIPGFTYPVKRHYLEDLDGNYSRTLKMCQQDNPQVIHEDVVQVIEHIHYNKPEGAILVFLPGWEDLSKIRRLLNLPHEAVVHLVHSKLKDSEQYSIFSKPPPGIRKIILATNIAETSITIDDVVYVIDTGCHKDMIFDNHKGINVIDMAWISKASANQRAGRAGRCSPGETFHLYSEKRYHQMPDYTAPKILNSSLTKVVLDSKVFTDNMGAAQFMDSLITPPETAAVKRAVDELKQLELLDKNEKLTPLGRTLVNFQLEPCLAKAMVNSVIFKCVTPIVDIITLFSSGTDLFGSLSLTDKEAVKKVKSQYCRTSDHLALMRIYEKWLDLVEEGNPWDAERFCRSANLVPFKLELINKLQDIHLGYLRSGLRHSMPIEDRFSDNDELVKAVLYSGTGTVLEHRDWDLVKNRLKTNVNVLVTRNNHKATITSESVNYKRRQFPSNFLVYINETRSNVRRTTTVRECSLIPAISVLLFNNNDLEVIQLESSDALSDSSVIIGIKNTKLQFLCDRAHANILIDCKQAIETSYRYLVHQLTCAGMDIPEFLEHWDCVLDNVDALLNRNQIE